MQLWLSYNILVLCYLRAMIWFKRKSQTRFFSHANFLVIRRVMTRVDNSRERNNVSRQPRCSQRRNHARTPRTIPLAKEKPPGKWVAAFTALQSKLNLKNVRGRGAHNFAAAPFIFEVFSRRVIIFLCGVKFILTRFHGKINVSLCSC